MKEFPHRSKHRFKFFFFSQNTEPGASGPKGAKGHRGPEGKQVRFTDFVGNVCVEEREREREGERKRERESANAGQRSCWRSVGMFRIQK